MRQLPLVLIALASPLAYAQEPPPPPPAEPAPAPAPAEPAEPTGTIKYDKGFTFALGDEFELKVVGRVQSRYELFNKDEEDPENGSLQHRFLIARGRVTLEGHAFGSTGYKFQTEFGRGFVFLRDYYIDQDLSGIHIRAGQWKRPYSRQHITSSGNLQMVDRSITDRFGAAGRDIGIAVHNNYEKSADGIEWAVGVFNGTGDRPAIVCEVDDMVMPPTAECEQTNVPPDVGPMAVVRLGYNMGGIKGYSESDLEGGPFRLAVGVSYMGDLAQGESDAMVHRVGADLLIKVQGASLTGGAYVVNQEDAMGDKQTDVGWHAQGGYFVVEKMIEPVARFAMIPVGDEHQLEVLGGLNWFLHGHALKLQLDGGVLHTTAPTSDLEVTDVQIRTQGQLIF